MSADGGNGSGGASVVSLQGPRQRHAEGVTRRARRPRGEAAPEAAASRAPQTLEQRVCAAAALGLDEEEIRARLELPAALEPERERELAQAYRRGRALGRARVKEAQFEAALAGRVTAQAEVLRRLGEPREDDEDALAGALPSQAEALAADVTPLDRD